MPGPVNKIHFIFDESATMVDGRDLYDLIEDSVTAQSLEFTFHKPQYLKELGKVTRRTA